MRQYDVQRVTIRSGIGANDVETWGRQWHATRNALSSEPSTTALFVKRLYIDNTRLWMPPFTDRIPSGTGTRVSARVWSDTVRPHSPRFISNILWRVFKSI